MATKNDSLTLTVASLSEDIDAEAFLIVLGNTVRALQEINKEISEFGSASVEWKIQKLGMSSPAFATIHGVSTSTNNGDYGPRSISTFVAGLRHLEREDTPPAKLNPAALRHLTAISQSYAKGVSRIDYASGRNKVVATRKIAENANTAIRKIELATARASGNYFEYGEIEGRLREVSEQSDRDRIVIVDDLTGRRTSCFFRGEDIEEQARQGWKQRVAVTGDIKIDKETGFPAEMRVEKIRILRTRDKLPQIDDLLGFDITGGMDAVEYIRGLRDAD